MSSGQRWYDSAYYRPFQAAVEAAGLDPGGGSYSAFRHTFIPTRLLAGTPIRLLADAVDSSVAMLEKTYSSAIVHHGDALLREHMLDLSDNVVPLRTRAG